MYEAGGVGGDVPTDMPRPLRVGQSVVARHPGTRTAADGIVLTIKPSKYRVQFNRWALTGAWLLRLQRRQMPCCGGNNRLPLLLLSKRGATAQ